MKKLLSVILALVMILSLSTVAFADETGSTGYEDMSEVTLTKVYDLTNAGTISPAETFTFSTLRCTDIENAGVGVTVATAPIPTIASATFEIGAAGDATKGTQNIKISLPEYTAVGVYKYEFTETNGGTAGVTYRSAVIKLVVTVIEQNGKVRVAAIHTESEGAKSGSFNNIYSAGSLNVKKNVTGLMGDKEKEFLVDVTFTAPEGKTVKSIISYTDLDGGHSFDESAWVNGTKTVTIKVKDDTNVEFKNVPYGVAYEVAEHQYEGYTTSYDNNKTGTISAASISTVIINDKGGTPDMGIALDSLPYVLLLAVACVGMAVVLTKKRRED